MCALVTGVQTCALPIFGIDAEPALDCWGIGLPGLDGMGLDRANTEMMGNTAAGYSSTGGSDTFHFPDGNATIARAIVRKLVPAVAAQIGRASCRERVVPNV